MEKIPRLSAQQRADLVAYLDGELDEPTTRSIEETLAKSPVARHEINMLVRTFSLLDELPRPSLGGEFTSKTIAIALQNDAPDSWKGFSLQSALRSDAARRGIICVSWLVGLSLAVVTGFLLTSRWIPNESQMLVDDLPVIESLDELSKVENIEFLRELKARVGSFHDNGENSRK